MSELKRHLFSLISAVLIMSLALSTVFAGDNVDAISAQIFFNAYGLIYLALTWRLFRRADVQDIRDRALRDRGKRRQWFLRRFPIMISIVVGWYSMQAVIAASPWTGSAADRAKEGGYPLWSLMVISALTVMVAWTLVQVAFAHTYGVLWYAEGGDAYRSIVFPGEHDPTYPDFAYLGFSIGMTFGPPDVELTNRRIRIVVLGHQLVAFVYNTVIVALLVTALTSLT